MLFGAVFVASRGVNPLVTLSLLGVGFFGLIVLFERLAIPWYHTVRQEEPE